MPICLKHNEEFFEELGLCASCLEEISLKHIANFGTPDWDVKIVNLSECDQSVLFELRPFLLGDNAGTHVVVVDGLPVGRYKDLADAENHAAAFKKEDDVKAE